MPLSHWRTPNDVIRVMPDTLMTTVLTSPRFPNPLKCSSTSPATFTSAESPTMMTSTAALGRVIALPVVFMSLGIDVLFRLRDDGDGLVGERLARILVGQPPEPTLAAVGEEQMKRERARAARSALGDPDQDLGVTILDYHDADERRT